MRGRREIGLALALLALCGAACSEAGLHKADGRGHFVDTLNGGETGCSFRATGKGKRTLEVLCDGLDLAQHQERAAKICANVDAVGFQTIALKVADKEPIKCEVAQGCSCPP